MKVRDKVEILSNSIESINSIGDIGVITESSMNGLIVRVTVENRENRSNWHLKKDLQKL